MLQVCFMSLLLLFLVIELVLKGLETSQRFDLWEDRQPRRLIINNSFIIGCNTICFLECWRASRPARTRVHQEELLLLTTRSGIRTVKTLRSLANLPLSVLKTVCPVDSLSVLIVNTCLDRRILDRHLALQQGN